MVVSIRQKPMAPTSTPRAHAAAGSMIQVGARIGVLLLGVVLVGYLARRLGTAEYGRYAVAVVLINWLMFTVVVVLRLSVLMTFVKNSTVAPPETTYSNQPPFDVLKFCT